MRLAERYRTFAVDEARGISPIYERLTHQIASAPDILRFLVSLPAPRRQPNLLLGAATFIAKRPPDIALLTGLVRDREAELRATMMARTTQTNEPARCAVLLPLLAALPQPIPMPRLSLAPWTVRRRFPAGCRVSCGAPASISTRSMSDRPRTWLGSMP